ncbi:hypothetical protein [Cohnella sp. GCM10027633]|uniref:hypothetical protein n=1 Tax=unclassified Cohnella TaxID=2636738 RepID=UPI003638CD6B
MRLKLSLTQGLGTLTVVSPAGELVCADRPYRYAIAGEAGGTAFEETACVAGASEQAGSIVATGAFAASGVTFRQTFRREGEGWRETIELSNPGAVPVTLDRIDFGFAAGLRERAGWRLCAVPFRVQLDGSVHDYTAERLIAGEGANPIYTDRSRDNPPLRERGLRSEAWAWGDGAQGIAVIKYNNERIEYAMAEASTANGEPELVFGGAGFAWYGEPSGAQRLAPGESFAFGSTYYVPYAGGSESAFAIYRSFLEERGHGYPADYDPPVHWNVLYDVGWHHSDEEKLRESYHKAAMLEEAAKAKACGCELLYLDPGWEAAEGLTLWDESRMGTVSDLVRELKDGYGLDLGFRTILRAYKPHWDEACQVKTASGEPTRPERLEATWGYRFWEPCLCDPVYYAEKLRRILAIARQGMRFVMLDEMDWRGPCHDPNHGHAVPSTPLDHVLAVCRLAGDVRRSCPGALLEVHDPVSPWTISRYAPTYFRQGPEGVGCYDENWGFEYMWNCIEDLRSGKALALYYYNLGCGVPLYLHLTMAADNDACVFFWWAASTVRHLGIGGKTSHPSVEIAGELPTYDKERRYDAYRNQMSLYRSLKPYFVRGTFHGISERIHLHTLEGAAGGVINAFNLEDEERELVFRVPRALLGADEVALPVVGALADWSDAEAAEFRVTLGPMSPGVIAVGDAAG